MEKKLSVFILVIVTFGVLLALFWPTFLGYPIQGIDSSIGLIKALQEGTKNTAGQWHHFYWMGNGSTDLFPSLYYFGLRFFPALWFQNLFYPLALSLAIIGMWVWLRRIGKNDWAALFGALGYGLMPHYVSLVYGGHLLVIEAMAWFPWLLWALTHTFRETSWRWVLWGCLSGVFWGLVMNSDIQRGFYLSLVAATMVLMVWWDKYNKDFWKTLPVFIGKSLVVGVLLLSVMSITLGGWLSLLEGRKNLQQTPSSLSGWNFATQFSQDPRELIDTLAFGYHGKLSGDPTAPYWGTKEFNGNSDSLGFFLAVFGLLGFVFLFKKETPKEEKRWLIFWGIWTVVSLLLAFGKFWPGKPFYWLFYHLPLMSSFRVPLKWLIVTGLGLVVLSSYTMDKLLTAIQKKDFSLWKTCNKIFLSLSGISVLWLFFHLFSSDTLYQTLYPTLKGYASVAVENRGWAILRMTGFALLLVTSSGLILLTIGKKMLTEKNVTLTQRIAIGLIFAGMLFDTLTINYFYFDKAFTKEGINFYRQDELITNLKKTSPPFRVATSLLVNQNNRIFPIPGSSIRQAYLTYDFPYHGIESFDIPAESTVDNTLQNFLLANYLSTGITEPKTLDDVLKANLPIFQMANVTYLVLDVLITNTHYPLVGIWRDKTGQPHAVYAVANSLPRLSWFGNTVTVETEQAAYDLLSRSDWPRNSILVLEKGQNLSAPEGISAKIQLTSYHPTYLSAIIESPTNGYILITSRYHKQWKAYVNDKPQPILKANVAQMAVFLPVGTHTLQLRYEAVFLPMLLGWLGVGIGIGSALLLLFIYNPKKVK